MPLGQKHFPPHTPSTTGNLLLLVLDGERRRPEERVVLALPELTTDEEVRLAPLPVVVAGVERARLAALEVMCDKNLATTD